MTSAMNVAVTATTRVRGRSGWRRQITRLIEKPPMATRASRSPPTPPPLIDPPTMTAMPIAVAPIARQVRLEVRSRRANRARTAAKMGQAAMMATTLEAAVRVTAVRKDVVETAPSRPVRANVPLHRDTVVTVARPRERKASDHATGVEKRPTMKAMVQPFTSESRSATRTSSASLDTRNIPVKANSRPKDRPDRGIRSTSARFIAGH